ncbi:MAG: threonylcarbamoyl-AMP synthase [Promethearchaeota archaeon]|nr:MAG: threonylcarbamoyl-AMP synthase [Candidatus Lokiarchaeota archaeon]
MGFLVKLSGKRLEDIQIFLEEAADSIISGGLVGFPTNSVYGLGGDPLNLELIERLYNIKFRDRDKGFLLLVSDIEEAHKIVEFNETAKKLAEKFWPGQLTLILNRKEPNIIPLEVSANRNTIGLRVPENEILLKILQILKSKGHFGGIIGTSANYSGEPPSISGEEIAKKFLMSIDFIIDGGKSESKVPTTIVDCTTETLKFLRIGKLSEEEIKNKLSND